MRIGIGESPSRSIGIFLVFFEVGPSEIIEKSKELVHQNRSTEFFDRVKTSSPVSRDSLSDIELSLFDQFPLLLQRIYSEVSNGGIGPGYGLIGFNNGTLEYGEDRDLVQARNWFLEWSSELKTCLWPKDLIPVVHMGCGIYECLSIESGTIINFDHHGWDETPETWGANFNEISGGFKSWWISWLNKQDTAASI